MLAHLLTGNALPGVPGVIVGVGFQRRSTGALLDDAVVTTDADIDIELSTKVGVKVAAGSDDFRETIELAWRAQATGRWAGLVAPPTASGIHVLKRLVTLAREHDDVVDFIASTTASGFIRARDRGRFAACRRLLDDINGQDVADHQYHAFLRRLLVIELDFDLPESTNLEGIVTILVGHRGIGRKDARALFSRLVEMSEGAAIAAAAYDRPGLERRLSELGVLAGTATDMRPILDALSADARRSFESKTDTVAGVHLDRAYLVRAVEQAISEGKDALISGSSGSGKSTVIRAVYEAMAARGPVLHLSGRRVEIAGSWPSLAADIGVPADRALLASVLAMNPLGRNGRARRAGARAIRHAARTTVNDLLVDLRQRGEPLNVILGLRDFQVGDIAWIDPPGLRTLQSVVVEDLADAEAAQIAQAKSVLGQASSHRRREQLPGGLLLLRLLHDARISDGTLAENAVDRSGFARPLVARGPCRKRTGAS